ncbi:MAG TPA: hypothetical protein VEJ63_23285 [Planctomycetota bacterium]|nr:hypothetical protein [Planctomycetota bacterium]
MRTHWRSSLAAGLVAAALGFTLALATSRESGVSAREAAQSRGVGVTLRITNPFMASNSKSPGFDPTYPNGGSRPISGRPQGFDLGDVAAGSFLVRYINLTGGVKPYSYVFTALLGSGADNVNGPPLPIVVPTLNTAGKLTANMPSDTTGATMLRFNLDVEDAIATNVTGRFKLNLLPANSSFRLAQDQLPLAQRGDTYHTMLQTVGGAGPYRFDVVPGTVFFNGSPRGRIEELGVTLTTDGVLYGRPLLNGSLDFTVRATDATFIQALSRDTSRIDQPFKLTIEANSSVNTEIAANTCTLRGDQVSPGKDSFSYKGVIDLKGDVLETLAGAPLVFRIGNASFSGNLDDKGKFSLKFSETGQFKLNISRNGGFSVKITGGDLTKAVGADLFADATDAGVIVYLEVGRLRTAEVLTAPAVVRNGRYTLNYRLGKLGASQGGAFQILSVTGADGRVNEEDGDKWLVRFIGVPRAIDGAAAADVISKGGAVTIRIGQGFSQQVTVGLLSTRVAFKGTFADDGIYQLYLDPKKFIHRLQTNTISSGLTGIPTAFVDPQLGDRNAPSIFPLGMDMAGISGDTGRVIIRNNKSWKQR